MKTDTEPGKGIIGRVFNLDGWKNVLTGLSSVADKHKRTRPVIGGVMSDEELEDIFIDDGLGANIVKMLPDDMFRERWNFDFPNEDPLKAEELTDVYKEILENIGVVAKIREGSYWARLYGGSVILIGALDGQSLEAPINAARIRSFEYLRVIDRSDIDFSKILFQFDPEKPRYGMPEYYTVKFTTALGVQEERKVHHSRIIEIHGDPIPAGAARYSREQRYWGISVLQNVQDKLSTVGSSIGSVSHLLDEFSVGKYKLGNLMDILEQPDGDQLIRKQVEIMDMTRSVFRSIYLDKEDDYIRENVSFAGVPEVLYIFFMLISSCTRYPITRLFGVSPAGMNSTGESDMRNYYDYVRSRQMAEAEPILLRLVRIISEWKKLPEPYITWNPLQSLSQKEQAEVEEKKALTEKAKVDTYQAYINAGIMEPYEARFLQFGDTLNDIPVPEDLLPPVPSLPEVPPGAEENQEGDVPEDDEKGEGENHEEPEDIETRIAELEEKEELSEEEQTELDDLKKRLKESNPGKGKKGKQ
jgi:phage-related protein (TIGR01555 family)